MTAESNYMRTSHGRQDVLPRAGLLAAMACISFLSPVVALCQAGGPGTVDAASLDEVIVTARLFREDITRVPMSVQALSGDFIERRHLTNLYDLQYAVPGLVLNNRGMFGAGISLRGVSDEGGGGLSVAPHLNGVYLGRSNLALARQFDLDRVEIVKGPQGTLYGRNATGGSLNVITRVPEPEYGAAIEGSWGSFDTARAGGHLNLAGDTVMARVSFSAAEGDGFIRNSIDDRRFAEEDYWGIRASVRVQPGDALTLDAMFQRVEDDGASGELWGPRRDRLVDPDDIHLTTVTLANPYHEAINDFASVNVAYEFGGLTLRSITGYARSFTKDLDDCAGVAELAGCVRGADPLRYEQYSQEFRLESMGHDFVDWIVGAYGFDSSGVVKFSLQRPGPPGPLQDYTSLDDETSLALFGDATVRLGERWRLNGGLRRDREEAWRASLGTGLLDPMGLRRSSGTWESTSWRLGLDYSPNERLFFYANVSTGFKSGGVTNDVLPNGEYDRFAPENLVAYEGGATAKLWGGRSTLRVSAFVYDFEDMQITTTTTFNGLPRTVVDNAGSASIRGIDFSSSTKFGDQFTFTGKFVWLPRREYVEFIDNLGNSLAGNKITRASEWSASASLGWRKLIAGRGEFGADLDYNYRTSFYFTKDNLAYQYQEDFGLLDANLRFDSSRGGWYVFAAARNLLDEDYFTQIFLQSAPGYPTRYEIGFGWRL